MRVAGWAQDQTRPDEPVSLLIFDKDRLVGRVLADRYRADLEARGIGDGKHAFEFDFPVPLSADEPRASRVCREIDGVELERSTAVVEPPPHRGYVDLASRTRVAGWVQDEARPDA